MSEWFQVSAHVHQGCILWPLLSAIAIDWVMCKATEWSEAGIGGVDGKKLLDLDFSIFSFHISFNKITDKMLLHKE